jgi:hypothetical protein
MVKLHVRDREPQKEVFMQSVYEPQKESLFKQSVFYNRSSFHSEEKFGKSM